MNEVINMRIRLGYVSLSKVKNIKTPSGTITYTYYKKLSHNEQKDKLYEVTKRNIEALSQILIYNQKNKINFYRITSSLIPLATHPDVLWDFSVFEKKLKQIGDFIKKHHMRVDMHPDQFNVLNSIHPHVVTNTIRQLEYHHQVLDLMGLENELLIIHIGSKAKGKENAKRRFINNFEKLPFHLKKRIIIENDDKVFNVLDVLELSEKLKIPFVFDYHHHRCNSIEHVYDYASRIFQTWNKSLWTPKVHLSSPKTNELDRRHADYVRTKDFSALVNIFKDLHMDFDIMIEAKMKDFAMFKLVKDIKDKYKLMDNTTIIIE